MNEELVQQAAAYQQQAEETEQALNVVNEQLQELTKFREHLKFAQEMKGKEIIASVGNGVFIKAEAKEDEFFVNVGAGIVVKKKGSEIGEILDGQIKKFKEVKTQLHMQLDMFAGELQKMIHELEHLRGSHNHEH